MLAGLAGRLHRPQPVGLHSGRHRPLLPAPLPPCAWVWAWAWREAGLSCCPASQGWLIISSGLGRLQALTRLPAAWCPSSEVEARGHPGSRLGWQDWGSWTAALGQPQPCCLFLFHLLHTHTCTHMHMLRRHLCTCAHTNAHTRVHICTCLHTGAHIHTCTQTFMHVCERRWAHILAHMCACTDTCASMCPHACTQTDTRFLPTAAPPSDTVNGNTCWESRGFAYKLSFLPRLLTGSRPDLGSRAGV